MAASDAVDDVVDSLLMRVVCKRSLLASTFNVQLVSIYCIDLKKCCTFLIHYCYGYTFAEVVDNCIGGLLFIRKQCGLFYKRFFSYFS